MTNTAASAITFMIFFGGALLIGFLLGHEVGRFRRWRREKHLEGVIHALEGRVKFWTEIEDRRRANLEGTPMPGLPDAPPEIPMPDDLTPTPKRGNK